jgi:hypothetical protein
VFFLPFWCLPGRKVRYFHLKVKNKADNFQAKGIPKIMGHPEKHARMLVGFA